MLQVIKLFKTYGPVNHIVFPIRYRNQSKTRFYSVASQMKLLVDTPEKVRIWLEISRTENLPKDQDYLKNASGHILLEYFLLYEQIGFNIVLE
jgi:hypothetical protein